VAKPNIKLLVRGEFLALGLGTAVVSARMVSIVLRHADADLLLLVLVKTKNSYSCCC
jgi:hypothetical protein